MDGVLQSGQRHWSPRGTAAVSGSRCKLYTLCVVFRARDFGLLHCSLLLLNLQHGGQSVIVLSVAARARFTRSLDLLTVTFLLCARFLSVAGWFADLHRRERHDPPQNISHISISVLCSQMFHYVTKFTIYRRLKCRLLRARCTIFLEKRKTY
jgi:hypothetical protein